MNKGFSLIELMIVILLIGIVAVIGVPRFLRSRQAGAQAFVARLNDLVSEAAVDAQRRGEPLRVFFSVSAKKISVQTLAGKAAGGSLAIPDSIELSDVIINGKSQFIAGGGEKDYVYFLINQEGISQEVKLILKDRAVATRNPSGGQYEFYLNPFTSVFRLQ